MAEAKSELEMKAEELRRDLETALANVAAIMEQAHSAGLEASFNVVPIFDPDARKPTGKFEAANVALIKRF